MTTTSLRMRLIWLTLVAVVPLIILIAINLNDQFQQHKEQGEESIARLAQSISLQQDQYIEATHQLLVAVAQLPEVVNRNARICNRYAADLLSQYPKYANLGAIALNGDIFCSGLEMEGTVNAADRSYFQEAVEQNDFAIGNYQIGRITGQASLNFGYPARDDDDTTTAIVFAALKLDWIADYATRIDLPEQGELTFIDREGIILARYPNPEEWIGEELAEEGLFAQITSRQEDIVEATDAQGTKRFYAFAPLSRESEAAYVIVSIPKSVVFADVNRVLIRDIIVVVVVSVIAFAVAWIGLSRLVVRPIEKLATTTQQLARGEMNTRSGLSYGGGEIGFLASSVDQMADALQQQHEEVTREASEREHAQQQEARLRQHMEQTVADYLTFVQLVSQGNLAKRLTVQHNGTLGHLGHGLNGMVENLHVITSQVQQASNDITTAVQDILSATTEQASSAAEQSSSLTQTNTTMDQVRSIVQQTMQEATLLAQESQSALMIAHQGTQVVEQTSASIEQIRQQMDSIAQTILGLAEQTQAIGTITTTVSELADQSNMLALNAAIEAARAGEQGKSFAVVAQQVRELAERSKNATAQVQDILNEIQRATNTAVMVTEEGTKGVEAGTNQAKKAGDIIRKIVREVDTSSQSNVQMASTTQQASVGLNQIGQALTNIQQATTQALTGTRQTEESARKLHELAQKLEQAIAAYHL